MDRVGLRGRRDSKERGLTIDFFPFILFLLLFFFGGGKGEEMLMFPFRGGFSGKLSQGRGGSIDFFIPFVLRFFYCTLLFRLLFMSLIILGEGNVTLRGSW